MTTPNVDVKQFIIFSKPFVAAAKNVFETMVFASLETGKPSIKKDTKSKGDISSVLGLNGERTVQETGDIFEYKAMLVISWPEETYLKIASAMLMEEYKEYNEDCADVGGEIVNMIMGNAKRDLSVMGYSSNMAIPSMVRGADHSINYPKSTAIIEIPVTCAHGPMYMDLCYAEFAK